jgi:hypothetical protein
VTSKTTSTHPSGISDAEAQALVSASAKAVARFLRENGNTAYSVRALLGACIGAHLIGAGKEATVRLLALSMEKAAGHQGDDLIDEFETFVKDKKAKRGTMQ